MLRIVNIKKSDLSNNQFNSTNVYFDTEDMSISEDEYLNLIQSWDFENWMHLFPKKELDEIILIKLDKKRIKNLLKISKCSLILNKISSINYTEYKDVKKYLNQFYKNSDEPYFMKLNSCSPKDSPFGIKINSVDHIILSLVTSIRCNISLEKDKNHYIVLKPWREDINKKKEFRVFVFKSKITAVSQYHWFNYCELDNLNLEDVYNKIDEFCMNIIKNINSKYDSFVIDVHLHNDNYIELIELNPWGPSGSCLFEWKKDFDQLYGKTNFVEFRILSNN